MKGPSQLGTTPAGAQTEAEASATVREMFSRIAPRYDLLNHLLSFSLDKPWRRRTARRFAHVFRRPNACILDLCCGTGDLTFALAREAARSPHAATPQRALILGSDFAHPMVALACKKTLGGRSFSSDISAVDKRGASAPEAPASQSVHFFESDALRIPVPDSSLDLVTCAFGFRNLANYESGLAQVFRVLKPGGEIALLEFSPPQAGRWPISALYRFYFRSIVPRIGRAVSGHSSAYTYLPTSVARFPSPEDLARLMSSVGFSDVRFDSWMFGVVFLHTALRRA